MNFTLLQEAMPLWQAGGWAMIPLALNALLICGKAVGVRLSLQGKGYMQGRWKVPKSVRGAGEGTGEDLDHAASLARDYLETRGVELRDELTADEVDDAFEQVRASEMPPIDRDLRFLKIAMSAAPLWGLLGTVSGMLTTFAGLAAGGGGDKTMDRVASGISEALITTQTGLMIALPGYFFHYYLSQHRARFEVFLADLESALTQQIFQRSGEVDTSPSEDASRSLHQANFERAAQVSTLL